ncbi:MAG: hypothetical protein ACQESG_07160 [Nanobdellota archaeon]
MKLEKIVATALLGATLMGCSTTYHGGTRMHSRDYTTTSADFSPTIEKPEVKNMSDMESYMERMEQFLDRTYCLEEYRGRLTKIQDDLEHNRFDAVQADIRSLVSRLDGKEDICSRHLRNELKDFTYVQYEFKSAKFKETKRLDYLKAPMAPFMIAGSLLDLGLSIITLSEPSGLDENLLFSSEHTKVQDEAYRKVLVNPYSGHRTYID